MMWCGVKWGVDRDINMTNQKRCCTRQMVSLIVELITTPTEEEADQISEEEVHQDTLPEMKAKGLKHLETAMINRDIHTTDVTQKLALSLNAQLVRV